MEHRCCDCGCADDGDVSHSHYYGVYLCMECYNVRSEEEEASLYAGDDLDDISSDE